MDQKSLKLMVICTLTCFAILGCSTIEVSQDYKPGSEFGHLKTYSWKSDRQEKTGDIRTDSSLMDERIRNAIEKTLMKKGFLKIAGKSPDFHVLYEYKITQRMSSSPSGTSVGVGYGPFGKYGMVGMLSGADVSEYDEGLLIIDFLKPENNTLLWRGKSTRTVYEHNRPEKIIQEINETVEKMLAQFPPGN